MDKVNGFANQISELYKRASDDFLCNRFVWNEIEDSLCEFREEINKQISEKKYVYLFQTEMYDYPIPFFVRIKGMWNTWKYHDFLYEKQYEEISVDTSKCQIRYGSGRIKHSIFMDSSFLEEIRYAGIQYILVTDKRRDTHDLNEFFEGKDGKLNLIQLFIEQFYKGDRLIVLDLCDGEFVFDIIYKV